jgi:hypothetical protein
VQMLKLLKLLSQNTSSKKTQQGKNNNNYSVIVCVMKGNKMAHMLRYSFQQIIF